MQESNNSVNHSGRHSELILLGRIGSQTFGIPGQVVERVLRMVAITPLPGAPRGLVGAITVHGAIIPVIDTYQHLGLPTPAFHPNQQLVIIHAHVPYAIWLDKVEQVVYLDTKAAPGEAIGFGNELVTGLVQLNGCLTPLLSIDALGPEAIMNKNPVVPA